MSEDEARKEQQTAERFEQLAKSLSEATVRMNQACLGGNAAPSVREPRTNTER
jgi:hypothetical protein